MPAPQLASGMRSTKFCAGSTHLSSKQLFLGIEALLRAKAAGRLDVSSFRSSSQPELSHEAAVNVRILFANSLEAVKRLNTQ